MPVPKCRECEYEIIKPHWKIHYYGCFHPEKQIVLPEFGTDIKHTFSETVSASEHRISPKWCPLRKAGEK